MFRQKKRALLTSLLLLMHASFLLSQPLFNKLTVLTKPFHRGTIQGHAMVTRSLLAGLKEIDIPFNYNPSHPEEAGDVIVVLANVHALADALRLKQQRPEITLLAGPNLMVWPTDDNGILLSERIDKVIVPSEPTRHMYAEIAPNITNRLAIWYAGINPQQWLPTAKSKQERKVLVYWKNQQEGPALKNAVVDLLTTYQWHPTILTYGTHTQQQYKEALDQASFAVFLSRSESQGIALAEAWAMNVPTIVWNPKERTNRGRVYSAVSACPYVTQATGTDWKTVDDLEKILQTIELDNFSPRHWVLEHMTDAHSAQLLIDLINSTIEEKK